ncbi:MAG TPA: glycerol-3-phosphate 1-O-acyltransferase PlsY [Gaiellaceae bacterium]|nr:glycerol-3-phosphate 1-O-acyltransferase PlsY [Gaiellaceae bacterium]
MLTGILVVAGYLAGSMTWGYWLVRVFRHEDIRTKGSGNIGASNVWRVYGRYLGLPTVLLDTAKGFAPALAGVLLVGHGTGVLAGAAAMLGHVRPLFLKFEKGGKMVATTGGAFLGVAPLVGLVGLGVWIIVFVLFRFPSVASMVASVSLIAWAVLLGYPWPVWAFAAVASGGVIFLHRQNIRRLLRGEENRSTLWRRWIGAKTAASL